MGASLWVMQLLLDESADGFWVFRRQPDIRRALGMAVRRTSSGLPYLSPEIQLLYKAKDPRPRDQADFDHIAPRLDPGARAWLRDALARMAPVILGFAIFWSCRTKVARDFRDSTATTTTFHKIYRRI